MTGVRRAVSALALLAVFSAVPALAQSVGLATLTGTVTDVTSRTPVADVVITISSPALQGERIVVTEPNGVYRVPQLPPGVYSLRLEKESYKPYTRGDIVLRADRTIRVNVELLPETLQAEEVLVVGKAPTIDVGSASTGYAISKDFVRTIPVSVPSGRGGAARTFETLALVAPQAQADTFGVSLNGTTSPENSFVVDGLTVGDPAFGINGSPLTAEFIEEVNVITGGYLPEYGRSTGGVLSAITKSGSNEFRGSVWGNWMPGALSGPGREIDVQGSALSFKSRMHNVGDFGAEIGGPIIKDRLWFYAAVAPNFERVQLLRNINRLALDDSGQPRIDRFGFFETERIEGTETSTFADVRALQYMGKLTYALSENHRVSFQVTGTPSRGTNQTYQSFQTDVVNANTAGEPGALFVNTVNDSLSVLLKVNSSFLDNRLLVDTTLGVHSQSFGELGIDGSRPGDSVGLAAEPQLTFQRGQVGSSDYHNVLEFLDSSHPGYDAIDAACNPDPTRGTDNVYQDGSVTRTRCPVTSWRVGGPQVLREGDTRRLQGRVVATYLLNLAGRHAFKAGVDIEQMRYHAVKAYTGGFHATERLGGASFNIDRNYGVLTGPGEIFLRPSIETTVNSLTTGAFIQDSWTLMDRLTINAGLRYDTQNFFGNDGTQAFSLPSQVSPRVGAIYDFTGEGRSKIYANYAVYYSQVPLNIAERSFGNEKQVFYRARNAKCSPTVPQSNGTWQPNPDYDPKGCGQPDNMTGPNPFATENSPNGGLAWVSADQSVVDPNIKPMSTNEIVAGGEYQVINDGRVGLIYTHRSLLNTIEDMSMDNGSSYFIGNPGYGIAAPFPKATREYDAVTLFFDKTFADTWITQSSYTLSRLYGNYNGLFVNATDQIDPNSNATYDLISLLPNQTGPLEADRTHQFKFFGAKQFILNPKMAVTVGGAYTASSGTPINYLVAHPSYGSEEGYLLPRGSGGRTPWVHRIDTRVGYEYRLTDTNVLSVSVDVFNMFNFQQVVRVDEEFTASTILPVLNGTPAEIEERIKDGTLQDEDNAAPFEEGSINPNFKNAKAYQAPRQVRLGLRVTF